MSDRNKSVLFTGHRVIAEADKKALVSSLYRSVLDAVNDGYTDFYCGGAVGFDTLAEECVLSLREKFRDICEIRLRLILPCENQSKYWKKEDADRYEEILSRADSSEYISDVHYDGCELDRNRKMAESASLCIAFCKNYGSGTGYTVKYCNKIGVRVINLAVEDGQLTFDI